MMKSASFGPWTYCALAHVSRFEFEFTPAPRASAAGGVLFMRIQYFPRKHGGFYELNFLRFLASRCLLRPQRTVISLKGAVSLSDEVILLS